MSEDQDKLSKLQTLLGQIQQSRNPERAGANLQVMDDSEDDDDIIPTIPPAARAVAKAARAAASSSGVAAPGANAPGASANRNSATAGQISFVDSNAPSIPAKARKNAPEVAMPPAGRVPSFTPSTPMAAAAPSTVRPDSVLPASQPIVDVKSNPPVGKETFAQIIALSLSLKAR